MPRNEKERKEECTDSEVARTTQGVCCGVSVARGVARERERKGGDPRGSVRTC